MFSRFAYRASRAFSSMRPTAARALSTLSLSAGAHSPRFTIAISAGVLTTSTALVASAASDSDFSGVRAEIARLLEDNADMGPTLVRLAWHSSGTYSKTDKTGGSEGSRMRYKSESSWGANAGLDVARDFLEPVKAKFPEMSYSDLWVLAGVVAIQEMGGPAIPFRAGRKDFDERSPDLPDGRLPDASQGTTHLRDIFYRMGFSDKEIVALSGAHALGRCHTENSGFKGPWTRAPTTFSNEYFRELVENTWTVKKWDGPLQYEDPSGELMMLPTDLCLLDDPEFKKWVDVYAKDEDAFFKDFSSAFQKLTEFGVEKFQKSGWFF